MKRIFSLICALVLMLTVLSGCGAGGNKIKIGVSFGVGAASRWVKEKAYMEEEAAKQGVDIEVRLNTTDKPKTQIEDCKELIDSGIDALVFTPRDAKNVDEILNYAKEKKVPVVNYARVILGKTVDLFVGYDSNRIGQRQGQFLTEMVYDGDYIVLKGDPNDYNASLLYDGAMRYIDPIKEHINILLDAPVPGWSADTAKQMVKDAIAANKNHVDAILAPNDALAGACAEALAQLGVTAPVVITGMDTELPAIKRIAAGTQACTFYLDLKSLACTAIDETINLVKKQNVGINAAFDNQSEGLIDAILVTGQLITKENLDELVINTGIYSHEEVYGAAQ